MGRTVSGEEMDTVSRGGWRPWGGTPVLVFTREAVLGVCSQFWQPDGDYKDGCPFGLHRARAL